MKRRFRSNVVCIMLLLAILVTCMQSGPALAADEEVKLLEQLTRNTSYDYMGSDLPIAQTFYLAQNEKITRVAVGLDARFGPTTAKLELIAGPPDTGTVMVSSDNVSITNTSSQMIEFTFNPPVELPAGLNSFAVYQTGTMKLHIDIAEFADPYGQGNAWERYYDYGYKWLQYPEHDLVFQIWKLAENIDPVAIDAAFDMLEDSTLTEGLMPFVTDEDGDPLTISLVNGPANGTLSLNADGTFTYKPNMDFHGNDKFLYRAYDGKDYSNTAEVNVVVHPVNDPPSFAAGPDQTVTEDYGPVTFVDWATSITPGPNEAYQTVSFIVDNDNNELFEIQPTIDENGTLSFKTAQDMNGVATVTVRLKDDGGTDDGGVDTSDEKTFQIIVEPVNDPPSFTMGGDRTVEEDSGEYTEAGWATDISPGPADEASQTLEFVVDNDNNSLFALQPAIDAATGTLTFTPAADKYGTANVTVRLKDDGDTLNGGKNTSDPKTFKITVTNVNDPPTITSDGGGDHASVNVPENSTAVTTVTATDPDAGTTLTFSLTGGADKDLFSIDAATGELTFLTAPNYEAPTDADTNNVYEVMVQVSDGTLSDTQTIAVTVTDVNEAPVITSDAAASIAENTTAVTTVTASDEDGDTLTYAITGGADKDLFIIDANTGELTFQAAPVFNTPEDADKDNIYEVEVQVSDGTFTVTQVITVTVRRTPTSPSNGSGGGPSGESPTATTPEKTAAAVVIQINGRQEVAGSLTRTARAGQTADIVTLDADLLITILEEESLNTTVSIRVDTDANILVSELGGKLVKYMAERQTMLEVQTEQALYRLPVSRMNVEALVKQFGEDAALENITVTVEIAEPTNEWVQLAENAARRANFTIVAPPLQFTVRASYEGKTVEVTNFTSYVERTIAIPDGVDPNQITTGVVIEQDETLRHVPTRIVRIDGNYYAKISSLTNSAYLLIWHPVEFADMSGHWAKNAVNDMGSRMVIEGTGEGKFNPDRDITRAEFAAIVVRGLGLKLENEDTPFVDVAPSAWYARSINTAYAYGLISGFEDGTFRSSEKITREQAMVIIARAMKLTGLTQKLSAASAEDVLGEYADLPLASDWAVRSIADSVQAGIVSGRDSSHLAPKDYITRAEVAVMIQRLLQKSELI